MRLQFPSKPWRKGEAAQVSKLCPSQSQVTRRAAPSQSSKFRVVGIQYFYFKKHNIFCISFSDKPRRQILEIVFMAAMASLEVGESPSFPILKEDVFNGVWQPSSSHILPCPSSQILWYDTMLASIMGLAETSRRHMIGEACHLPHLVRYSYNKVMGMPWLPR